MNLYLYEDSKYKNFLPVTSTRPVYSIRAGIRTTVDKVKDYFEHENFGLASRNNIAPLVASDFSDITVNIIKRGDGDVLFLNGRIKDFGDIKEQLPLVEKSTIFISDDDEIVAVYLLSSVIKNIPEICTPDEYLKLVSSADQSITTKSCSSTLFQYCWDIVAAVSDSIKNDFDILSSDLLPSTNIKVADNVNFINDNDIFLGDGVKINPMVLLDASMGPIYIDDQVTIESMVSIYGPCYIGIGATVMAGKIVHSSIGKFSKVGGEIENSILQSYVNKAHQGYIGHSLVGSWVNFGAMTTNSDLKNNYSEVRLTLNGENVNSQMIKVGSFIGDHCKFGIGTLLNTGINIGVGCNIFGGGLTTDKEIPPFSWGNSGNYTDYEIEKAIATARMVCGRRSVELSQAEIELLESISKNNVSNEGILDFK